MIALRDQLGKSPKEIAKLLEVSLSYYYKVEEQSRNPSFNFISKYKSIFNVDVNEYFFN